MRKTIEDFERTVQERFGGVLTSGQHSEDGEACVLEAAHATLGDAWSDDPDRWPDMRPLNDARWSSDAMRTTHMVRLMRAYWDWGVWSQERQLRTVTEIVRLTVQHVIADLPGLPNYVRVRCRAVRTFGDAAMAACVARSAEEAAEAACVARSAAMAARAARSAEEAARAAGSAKEAVVAACVAGSAKEAAEAARAAGSAKEAARAARSAEEADRLLVLACDLWVQAAQEGADE